METLLLDFHSSSMINIYDEWEYSKPLVEPKEKQWAKINKFLVEVT